MLPDGLRGVRVAQDRADVGPDEPWLALGVLDGPDRIALECQLKGLVVLNALVRGRQKMRVLFLGRGLDGAFRIAGRIEGGSPKIFPGLLAGRGLPSFRTPPIMSGVWGN